MLTAWFPWCLYPLAAPLMTNFAKLISKYRENWTPDLEISISD